MSELLGKTASLESIPATLLPAYQGTTAEESGHACKGEGRCCGGCRNPKRPLASANEAEHPRSNQQTQKTLAETSDLPPAQS